MMRRLLPCLCLVLLFGSTSFAQNPEYPKADFTAAYVLNSLDTNSTAGRRILNGVSVAVGGNIKKYFAIEGDLTFSTRTISGQDTDLFTYLVGPRFTRRSSNSKLQPFVHALFGGGRLSGFGTPTNGWAGKMGGGLDIVVNKHLAIRVVEVDYYRYHGHVTIGTQRLNNALFTFGIRLN